MVKKFHLLREVEPMTLLARALLPCLLALLASAALATYAPACPIFPPVDGSDILGGKNISAPNLTNCHATTSPVNCATGNQFEEQTDLVLGGRGPALAIHRTYNSQMAAEAKEAGPWGYGWSGPYSSNLEFNKESGAVTVVQENGATAAFALEGGKYVPGAWIQATLVKEGESYLFTLPTQEKLWFNAEGRDDDLQTRRQRQCRIDRTPFAGRNDSEIDLQTRDQWRPDLRNRPAWP
jgi:hypothetical protein